MGAMPRYGDKITAFHKSVTREPSGRKVVRTGDFVRNLAELNHHLPLSKANRWIKQYAKTFRDASTEEGKASIRLALMHCFLSTSVSHHRTSVSNGTLF